MKFKHYSKKMLVGAVALFAISTPSFLHAQESCNELFISEIIKDNVVDVHGTPYSNYVIELFNPKAGVINAANYSLEFRDANSVITTVTLRGSIAAKSTYAISHSNAENNVLALTDMDTTLLDFSIFTEVKLINNITHNVIDAFGEPITQSTITFNYLLFMQDPYSYLSQYNLTLKDLDHIDLRRGFFVTKGVPFFNVNDVMGTWAFYTGTDHSDLRRHECQCNQKVNSLPVVGYIYVSKTLDENTSLNNAVDDIDIHTAGSSSSPILINQLLNGGTATVNTHIVYYQPNGPNPNSCYYTIGQTLPNCTYARTLNNLFVGTKWIKSTLQNQPPSSTQTYTVDNATKDHRIDIRGNSTTSIKEFTYERLPITIYPSVTPDILYIYGNIDCKYTIITTEGKVVKEGDLFNLNSIDVSSFANGMYIINCYNFSGRTTHKFVKQ